MPVRASRVQSHLLCCNKFDFVRQAIETNPFRTDRFGWIDAHLSVGDGNGTDIKICEQYTDNMVPYVLSQITDDRFHIQILNVNDKRFLDPDHKRAYYQQYRWVVCGSFFVCGPTIGLKWMQRLQEIVRNTTADGYGHAEEMCFLELLEEYPDDLVPSYGDYRQILNNFDGPTKNVSYIVEYIANGYFQLHYYRECMGCCRAVLDAYEQYKIPMDYEGYMRTLALYYLSAISDPAYLHLEAGILRNIEDVCDINPAARQVWETMVH